MLRAIAGFELRYQARSPLFAILFVLLFALTFAMITGDPADGFGASTVAPGDLQREWTANGRRYFHYRTPTPIKGFWAYVLGRYAVKRDRWRDVAIEIYHHPEHAYNVDRMVFAVKKSLDYFTASFSPYQHRQVRILEFPGYANFAQSFPNMIPYSETLGFVADLRESLDYVFYATAHEVAHQWWGHQISPANVQGATMLNESMAQYSALMVLDKEFDRPTMRRYLRWELDRYLVGRGEEILREMPLMLVERQDYVHYNKGALAMYALREAMGEERVNRALGCASRRQRRVALISENRC